MVLYLNQYQSAIRTPASKKYLYVVSGDRSKYYDTLEYVQQGWYKTTINSLVRLLSAIMGEKSICLVLITLYCWPSFFVATTA